MAEKLNMQTSRQDEIQAVPAETNYLKAAMFLADSYPGLLETRAELEKRISGSWVYTMNMAIADLNNLTVSYEGEHVQSSNISNPTERIALKLTDEYMAKKQREMDAEKAACINELLYVSWKIDTVETAVKERLNQEHKDIFTLLFKGHKTYNEAKSILYRKRGEKRYNRNLAEAKTKIWNAIIQELEFSSTTVRNSAFLDRLCREAEDSAIFGKNDGS